MSGFIPWDSQPLDEWAKKYARGKFIDLDGLSTHYIEKGSGEPLIILHGFFFDTNMWNDSIDVLAEKYKIYVMDLWGFGFSSREPLDYGYPLYTEQLKKFMDALGLQKASLIGQSMGAGTIMNFTVSNREKVNKIVLVDAAGMPNRLPLMGRISNLPSVGELMYGMKSDFIRKFTQGKNFVYNKNRITDAYYANLTRFHKIHGTSKVMLYVTRKQFFDTLLDEITALGEMNVPILIFWGREETSISLSIGQELHKLLKGSQFEVLDQAGHCSNMDQPERFNKITLDFLGQG